jgi:hypothetical protein
MWPDTRLPDPPTHHARRLLRATAILVVAVGGFLGITAVTGFPGPGPVRRYPYSDLEALADQINALHCDQSTAGSPGAPTPRPRPIASVDFLTSRVHLSQPYLIWSTAQERPELENTPGDTSPYLSCTP